MTALPNKYYSGCHKATEEDNDQETLGKELWRGKCGQTSSGLVVGRWRKQHRMQLDGDKWSVVCAALKVTKHKSRHSQHTLQHKITHEIM